MGSDGLRWALEVGLEMGRLRAQMGNLDAGSKPQTQLAQHVNKGLLDRRWGPKSLAFMAFWRWRHERALTGQAPQGQNRTSSSLALQL